MLASVWNLYRDVYVVPGQRLTFLFILPSF